MNIPEPFLTNIKSEDGAVEPWTAKLFHEVYIRNSEGGQSLRTTERFLSGLGLLPDTISSIAEISDENSEPINTTVANSLTSQAKAARHRVYFLQLKQHSNEKIVLFVNDARSGRKWLILSPKFSQTEFVDALETLCGGKDTLIWPHVSVLERVRALCDVSGSATVNTQYGNKLHFGLSAFKSIDHQPKKGLKNNFMETSDLGSTHLGRLEAESIHIIREVVAQAENPVMLYSLGKDSAVMLRLAQKAFYPAPLPFPLMHIDTRWKFQEMYQFRDQLAQSEGLKLIVHVNPEGVKRNINPFDHGSALHTDIMKTEGLKQALDLHKFDVAFGGARRDEEKSRAKERVFSFRNSEHRWDPKNQRPELWSLYNGYKREGDSIRAFPLSNWTELDVWQYIYQENIPLVPLYFSKERPVIERDGMLLMIDDDRIKLREDEEVKLRKVRFRTLGCYPLTGAVESDATDVQSIILELVKSRVSERQGRAIDSDSSASMEKKKQEGYF